MLNPKNKLYRWGPISACPLFMYYTIEPAFAPLQKLLGVCYPDATIFFKDNTVTWMMDENELVQYADKFNEIVVNDNKNRQRYFDLWEERTNKLRLIFNKLEKIDLRKLNDNELKKVYKEFALIYYDWWTLTISVELFTSVVEPQLAKRLKEYYADKDTQAYNKAFATLTSPLVLTFYRHEQKDLLNISALPKDKQVKALKIHQKKYYWILNSYLEAKVLDLTYFQKELETLATTDYKSLLQEIESYVETIKKQKKEILNEINPDTEFLDTLSLVETLGRLQDERKMNNFIGDHYLELFVKEFASRVKAKSNDLKYLLSDELANVLETKNLSPISDRKKCLLFDYSATKIDQYSGDKALLIARQYEGAIDIEQNVIQGVLASAGETNYFRGTAKVVLTVDEMQKLEDGDILITTMTSPDFVMGMKKAGAIITDTGGMLCHAAIVSRELRKPCIVGTEIATRVIHDGDIVELHCGQGTVKIIKTS